MTKIIKHFAITFTGKYQSCRFESGGEIEADSISECAEKDLATHLVTTTLADAEAFAEVNEPFRILLGARKKELEEFKKQLEKNGGVPSNTEEYFL